MTWYILHTLNTRKDGTKTQLKQEEVMQQLIQISAKTIGQLALPSFCERCFWVRLRCHDKFPFAIFPGIFASIDSYSKKVTAAHFATHGRVPLWFDGFGE